MKIKTLNQEQDDAVQKGMHFIEYGKPDEWLVIGGKAGTGKTTIAQIILEKYIKTKNILVCALSHKAKLVISDKLQSAFGERCVTSKSVAGALGMNMNNETGHFEIDRNNENIPPIKKADIILVDEGSMINEEGHELIMSEKRKSAKVIYLGDIRQLPPIRKIDSEDADKPSPIFYSKHFSVLKERIRQGEESPILPFADYFGDNTRMVYPQLYPAPDDARKNIVNEKGALVFSNSIYNVLEYALPLYKYAVDKKNMNVVKTVTYRNDARKKINNYIRQYLFGENVNEYVKGDLLMFQDNYSLDDIKEPISNSFEIQVTKAAQKKSGKYKIWEIEFIYDGRPVSMPVLDSSELKVHAQDVSDLFVYAKSLDFGTQKRIIALQNAWGLKNKYAPIDYSYAITSHKSQGSTYNTVIVDELDIMDVKMTTNKSKSHSLYTALTRAAISCIVIDGQKTDSKYLDQAVLLSTKNLKN